MRNSAPPASFETELSRLAVRWTALGACLFLLAATLGCGGGGGDDDQSPTGPGSPTAVLGGTWEGTSTTISAQGTCLADNYRGASVSARWRFTQTGASATGQLTLNHVVTCQFRASISGSTVSIFAVPTSNSCTVYTAVCQSSPNRQLRVEMRTDVPALSGRVVGSNLTLTGPTRARVYEVQTGREIGEHVVNVVHELRKTS